jgi:hypothetical protein
MLSEDDKRFYELYCKQVIHQKRKKAISKMPERVYNNFDKNKKVPENIEAKYEMKLWLENETKELNECCANT